MTVRKSLLIAVLVYFVRWVCGQGVTELSLGETYSFTLQSEAPRSFTYELSPPAAEQVSSRAAATLVVQAPLFAKMSTDFHVHIEPVKPYSANVVPDIISLMWL